MEISIKWNVCRICMDEESAKVSLLPIFEDASLPEEIFECSGIQLKKTDNLPEKICKKCLTVLKYALKFRTTCRKTTEYLKSILVKTQTASNIFKSVKPTEEEAPPFENIDYLDEEQFVEFDGLVENNEFEYIIQDVDDPQTDNESSSTKNSEKDYISVKNSEPDEVPADNESISQEEPFEELYVAENEIKQETSEQNIEDQQQDEQEEQEEEDEFQSLNERIVQMNDFIMKNESVPKMNEFEIKNDVRRYVRKAPLKSSISTYICDICGNNFTKKALLSFHMKIHRNEKTHECEICSKRFNSPCNLRAHIRVHTGEKPFQCQFCDRKFADRSTQIKHERIHTNEKPYHCGSCGKSFSLSTSLKAHEKMHSGEKPYRCEPCSKAFTLPHQLKAHLLTNMHRVISEIDQ